MICVYLLFIYLILNGNKQNHCPLQVLYNKLSVVLSAQVLLLFDFHISLMSIQRIHRIYTPFYAEHIWIIIVLSVSILSDVYSGQNTLWIFFFFFWHELLNWIKYSSCTIIWSRNNEICAHNMFFKWPKLNDKMTMDQMLRIIFFS